MRIRNLFKRSLEAIVIGSIILTLGCRKSSVDIENNTLISSGYTVTSYCDVDEAVYSGNKIKVFDSNGKSLGYYKTDFLEQVKIDGSGKGDNIQNDGRFLHYNYNINDGKTCYLADKSLGAYNNELVPWTGDKPSVAINPPLPYGAMIKFIELGPDGKENPEWVINLLLTKTFYADDRFFLPEEDKDKKKIDVYVGLQKVRQMEGTPESLLMHNVTIQIIYPGNNLLSDYGALSNIK